MISSIRPQKLRGRPGMLARTPYDESFVEQLKAMVPRRDRWYNPSAKGWWIAEKHLEIVLHLMGDAFGAIIIVDEDGREITHEGGEKLEQGRLL